MASITQTELQNEVGDHSPGHEPALIARCANRVLLEIAREFGQPERTTLTTTAPVSSGSLTVILGSTALTGSGTSFDSPDSDEQMIQIAGSDTWFRMAQTSPTAGTLSSAWPAASAVGATYEIAYPIVTLPADVLRVLELRIDNYAPLEPMFSEVEPTDWFAMEAGRPTHWREYKDDSSGNNRIQLGRAPDDTYAITMQYVERPTLFDGTTGAQTVTLAGDFNDLLVDGTVWGVKRAVHGIEEAREFEREYKRKLNDIRRLRIADMGRRMQSRQPRWSYLRNGAVTEN